jgi:hypothetical protein
LVFFPVSGVVNDSTTTTTSHVMVKKMTTTICSQVKQKQRIIIFFQANNNNRRSDRLLLKLEEGLPINKPPLKSLCHSVRLRFLPPRALHTHTYPHPATFHIIF